MQIRQKNILPSLPLARRLRENDEKRVLKSLVGRKSLEFTVKMVFSLEEEILRLGNKM